MKFIHQELILRSRSTVYPILTRLGIDLLVGRITHLRDDDRFKAVGPDTIVLPYPNQGLATANSEGEKEAEVWFNWAFVDFWKSNYCKSLRRAPPLNDAEESVPTCRHYTEGHHHRPESAASLSKGQIHVRLYQARGLNVRSSDACPYVVVQFEQNEFVSRGPTDEDQKSATPLRSDTSSSRSMAALLAIINTVSTTGGPDAAASVEDAGGSSSKPSSRPGSRERSANSSAESSKSEPGPRTNTMFGSAHNPVWKHEVTL